MCAHSSLGEREVEGPGREAGCLLFAWLRATAQDSRRGFTALSLQELYMEEGECKEGEFWMCIHPLEPQ